MSGTDEDGGIEETVLLDGIDGGLDGEEVAAATGVDGNPEFPNRLQPPVVLCMKKWDLLMLHHK